MDEMFRHAQQLLLNEPNFLGITYTVPVRGHRNGSYTGVYQQRQCAQALGHEMERRFSEAVEPFVFETNKPGAWDEYVRYRLELYVMTRAERTKLLRIIDTLARFKQMEASTDTSPQD